jgi:glycosyltransferase involved in cell wall biosynthesis
VRIVFVAWKDTAHPQAGGSEVFVDRVATGLLARGHEVALISGGPVEHHAYPVVDAGGKFDQYLRVPLTARRYRDWDLLVDVSNGVPYFSPLWRRGPSVMVVHHVHEDQWPMNFPAPVAKVGWALESRAVPWVYRNRLVLAVSPSTRDALIDIGVKPEQIRLMHNGTEAPPDIAVERATEPTFVALGRLVPHKRIERLLAIWDRVYPAIGGRLLVLGDGPERERLERLAGPGVEMLGTVGNEEKHRALGSAWLLVHTAQHEGWGIVVTEAAAWDTPTLAFNVPGVRDVVVDGETGVLVADGDDDAMARAWIALARDPSRRKDLGRAAHLHCARYTWEAAVDALLAAADEATGAEAATGGASRRPTI